MTKLLIFDFDGTLYDTFDLIYNNIKKTALKYGIDKIKTKKDFIAIYNKNFYYSMKRLGLRQKDLPVFKKETQRFREETAEKIKLFKGISSVLKQLHKQYKLAVISSSFKTAIKKSLVKSKILQLFDLIAGAEKEESKTKKIKSIIKTFKVKPNQTIYIGDTVGDVEEARKAKIKSIAVTWGYQPRKLLKKAKPDFIISKPEQLLRIK